MEKKPLIIALVAIVAVGGLALLMIFGSGMFAGKAIAWQGQDTEIAKGTVALSPPLNTQGKVVAYLNSNEDFQLEVISNLGEDKVQGFEFILSDNEIIDTCQFKPLVDSKNRKCKATHYAYMAGTSGYVGLVTKPCLPFTKKNQLGVLKCKLKSGLTQATGKVGFKKFVAYSPKGVQVQLKYDTQESLAEIKVGAPIPKKTGFGVAKEICTNNIDDDGDGDKDCEDSDCKGKPTSLGFTCCDKNDNDWDGKVDCADSDCVGAAGCVKVDVDKDGVDDKIEPKACQGKGSSKNVYTTGSIAGCLFGDVNGDGCVNSDDIKIIKEKIDLFCETKDKKPTDGDVNGDGCVDGEDIKIIKLNIDLWCEGGTK